MSIIVMAEETEKVCNMREVTRLVRARLWSPTHIVTLEY